MLFVSKQHWSTVPYLPGALPVALLASESLVARHNCIYMAVAFYARDAFLKTSHNSRLNNIVVHTILTKDGGYFCLSAKVAPPCGNSVNTVQNSLGPAALKLCDS
jgi:hypothetical protein